MRLAGPEAILACERQVVTVEMTLASLVPALVVLTVTIVASTLWKLL